MIIRKDKITIPVVSVFTGLLFCAIYSFKLGEAFFYDYPSYYIYLNIQDVINYSLKALWFYGFFILGLFFIRSQAYSDVIFLAFLVIAILNKFFGMILLYYHEEGSALGYINSGSIFVLIVLIAYCLNKTFIINEEYIEFNLSFSYISICCFLLLNIFIGLNYHSIFPKSTWQTVDGKVLVGIYKDNFILRECKEGKSYFYLQEPKDLKFEMLNINTSGVLGLRCISR